MKTSELIKKLTEEMSDNGDSEIDVIVHLGMDEEGVRRFKKYENISVITSFLSFVGSDKISGTMTTIIINDYKP